MLQRLSLLFGQALAPVLTLWGAQVSGLEIFAFILALAMVVLNMRVHPAAWPLAMVSSLLYVALFWNSRLYGDAGLQVFFALMAAWGWWQWLRGTTADGSALTVRALPARQRGWALIAFGLAWPVLGLFLRRYTDTDVPWWDAFPTALSVLGQWLLGRKYIENWIAWAVVNLVSVALFAYKGLWLTVLLYALFAVMSALGWRAWKRMLPP